MPTYRLPVRISAPNASPSVNVWHYRTGAMDSSAIDNAASAAAISAIRGLYSSYAPYFPSGTTITSDGPVDVRTSGAGGGTFATVSGTGTGGSLPPHLALCISWKTSIRARRGMGRTFIGPLVTGFLETNGTVSDAVLTSFRGVAQTLLNSSLADNGWAVGIWGQESAMPGALSEARRLAPHVFRDVVAFTVKDQFAVMRSRRP